MTRLVRHLVHYAVYLLAAVLILVSTIALTLRFVIMPDINRYKADIEASAGRAIGVPVRIEAIAADWWGINPRIRFSELSLLQPGHVAPLRLGQVEATLSWLSLVLFEPHLVSLDLHRPSLEIRRDTAGVIHVGGIPVNIPGTPSRFPDWLLRQRALSVGEGRIVWIDETLAAPPLVLDGVTLRVASRFSRHAFGLTARPPAIAGRRLDIRGDLEGPSVHQWEDWTGQIYFRVDGASASALHTWAPWAQAAVRRSTGDLRAWIRLGKGQIQALTGDVRLADVAVSLAEDLPDMSFNRVSGRLGWKRDGGNHVLYIERLRIVAPSGQTAEPTGVSIVLRPKPSGELEMASMAAGGLRLEAITAIAGALPVPRQYRELIATYNPQGYIDHAEFAWLGRDHFRIKARFQGVGVNATTDLPGFSNLSGEIDSDETRGGATLSATGMHLVYDKVFRQPLDLGRLEAKLTWSATPRGGYRFQLQQAAVANADLEATADGSLEWHPGAAPVVDLHAQLSRGEGNAVWRYLPWQVADDAHSWVKASIVGGRSPDTRLVLRGPLDRFPFDKGGGEFRIDVKVEDAVLEYSPHWPRITGINGWLVFKDKSLLIDVDRGESVGARLGPVQGIIPDLHHGDADKYLEIDGRAVGPTAVFLDFIRHSPVNEYTDRFTEGMSATGAGELKLRLHLPLRDARSTRVAGSYTFTNNIVLLDKDLPSLADACGTLAFTDASLKSEGLRATLREQPVVIDLGTEPGGKLQARVKGNFTAAVAADWLPAALALRLKGSTPVEVEIGLRQHKASVNFRSDLVGLGIELPAPIGKTPEQSVSTRLSTQEGSAGPMVLALQYGNILAAAIARGDDGKDRVGIVFGEREAALPKESGLVLRGNLRSLDLDAWRRLDTATSAKSNGKANGNGGLAIRDINLTFNELRVLGRRLHDINVQARPLNPGWQIRLAGQEVQGDVEYGPMTDMPGNRLHGHFRKIDIPDQLALGGGKEGADLAEMPREVDFSTQSLIYKGRELGELDAHFDVERDGLRIRNFTLRNPDIGLSAGGWMSASPRRHTQLDLDLSSPDLGRMMKRLGLVEGFKGGEVRVNGKLGWLGRPEDFALENLDGLLKVGIKDGRFIRLDPGAAKLLGILSLQALPRRITLDFRDVFSEGFAFDDIHGDVYFERGVGYLPDLGISGPAATIAMKGKLDLVKEAQELRLHIQPRLDEGVAVAGALLGGPVLGVGALVASKILKDPIAKAASFEYLVTGSWSDPVVTKLGWVGKEKNENRGN